MFSFSEDEYTEISNHMNEADLEIAPPPIKRVKTEEMPQPQSFNTTISLSTFLTTPHYTTRNNIVEVISQSIVYKFIILLFFR